MIENRKSKRDPVNSPPVACWIGLPDGTELGGVVNDISADGARIHASTTSVKVGMKMRVVFRLPYGEKTASRCEVKHIDRGGDHFGVKFESAPAPVGA